MKVFQIIGEICANDASRSFNSAAETVGRFPPDVIFVDAPDYVFEGWGYDFEAEGDDRFIKPIPPEGWFYDDETGTFYQEINKIPGKIATLKAELAASDYKIIKSYEYQLKGLDAPYDMEALYEERQAMRDEINRLQAEFYNM